MTVDIEPLECRKFHYARSNSHRSHLVLFGEPEPGSNAIVVFLNCLITFSIDFWKPHKVLIVQHLDIIIFAILRLFWDIILFSIFVTINISPPVKLFHLNKLQYSWSIRFHHLNKLGRSHDNIINLLIRFALIQTVELVDSLTIEKEFTRPCYLNISFSDCQRLFPVAIFIVRIREDLIIIFMGFISEQLFSKIIKGRNSLEVTSEVFKFPLFSQFHLLLFATPSFSELLIATRFIILATLSTLTTSINLLDLIILISFLIKVFLERSTLVIRLFINKFIILLIFNNIIFSI